MMQREPIENLSGFDPNWSKLLPVVKKRHCVVMDQPLAGDQPKHLVRLYRYGEGRRSNMKSWPIYIAKFGRKWYAMESVTEYLLNRIGEEWEMRMAESELMVMGGQVRFLSRYFLNGRTDRLVHGAEIYSSHLNDSTFVKDVEVNKWEGRIFSYQFACEAIETAFPKEKDELIQDFTTMLLFDAVVGAMDRHFYNWGVIMDVRGRKPAVYSPIYDTARALFWNEREAKLASMNSSASERKRFITRYCENSRPKMGLDGLTTPNHFSFVQHLLAGFPNFSVICNQLLSDSNLDKAFKLLDTEFVHLLSPVRITLIKYCLEERFLKLRDIAGLK
jgi:uncharacterized protein (DUF2164 family)